LPDSPSYLQQKRREAKVRAFVQKTGRGGSLTREDEKWGRCRDAEREGKERQRSRKMTD